MFRLAGHLGMTVRELGDRMDAAELAEWAAYDRIEPLPDPWHQTALLASLMCNLWGGGRRKFTPADFIPRARAASSPVQSPQEGLAMMAAITAQIRAKQQQVEG